VSNEDRGTLQVAAELLTVQEVAALCRVSTDSVYRAIQRGELEAEEIFGCLRIRRGALKEYRRERRRALRRRMTQLQSASQAGREVNGSLRALMRGERRRAA
jgi:excisionase family DNA binding protein